MVALVVAGCLPQLATDAELAAALTAAGAGDGGDTGVGGDAGAGGDAGGDGAGDAVDDAGAGEGLADGVDAASDGGDAPSGVDAGADAALDTGDGAETADAKGNLGASCSSDGQCFAPADVAACKVPICAGGTCALTTAAKGTPCAATGLTLKPCEETRCDAAGGCGVVVAADGAACDADGDGCTAPDTCVSGACKPGGTVDCPATGDACGLPTCTSTGPMSHVCAKSLAASGTACDDGKLCTVGDLCDGGGLCVGAPNPCTATAAPCATASCDLDKDACVGKPKAAGAACDDGDPCTKPGTCSDAAACQGEKPFCDDGNACTDDVCDGKGGCSYVPHVLACSDGDACTIGETCDGKGSCIKGKPRLFELTIADKEDAHVHSTLDLAGGDLLYVGERNEAPFAQRVDVLGQPGWSGSTGGYVGTWSRALERPDGLLLAGTSFPKAQAHAPLLARLDAAGKQLWALTLAAEATDNVHVAALLPGPAADQAFVAIQKPVPGAVTVARLLVWSESTKAVVAGKDATEGGAGDPRVLGGGAFEAETARWVLVGRRQVQKAGKAWHGWVHRRLVSMLYGGEQDYLPTGASGAELAGVTVVAGGYLCVGSATVGGADVGWVLRLDDKLGVVWQRLIAVQAEESTLFAARLASWGEIVAAGFASTGPNAADSSDLVVRLRADGTPLATALWPAGGGYLRGVRAMSDGWLLSGDTGLGSKATMHLLRTSPWLHRSCAEAGGCAALAASACDDGKACAAPGCVAGGGCKSTPLAASTPCGDGKVCDASAVCK